MKRRVVITGIGLVTPLGIGLETTWGALLRGESGIGPITHFDTSTFATKFAGEVKGLEVEKWIEKREAKTLDPFLTYAIVASQLCVDDAGLPLKEADKERIGVF